jgi:hypothetical protein
LTDLEKLEEKILNTTSTSLAETALEVFNFQFNNVAIYNAYCKYLGKTPNTISSIEAIPFLPIQLFKTQKLIIDKQVAEVIFESSGTMGSINSKHYVANTKLYTKSFMRCFNEAYGDVKQYCILGLLPSYLERSNSSLVYMVSELIKSSANNNSGFYLHDFNALYKIISENEQKGQATLLFGVTYALIDFAEEFPLSLKHTTIIETGGMKGRKKEISKAEAHAILKQQFAVEKIHSEYGMTELLSQSYSKGNGIFLPASQMKILLREEDDPLTIKPQSKKTIGAINIIDLANIYSCAFIATDDVGILHENGSFEVTGRLQNSDIRGCGLMISSY